MRAVNGRHAGRRRTRTDAEWDAYGRVSGSVRTQRRPAEDALEHKVCSLLAEAENVRLEVMSAFSASIIRV